MKSRLARKNKDEDVEMDDGDDGDKEDTEDQDRRNNSKSRCGKNK